LALLNIGGDKKTKVSGLSEMLITRRLKTVGQLNEKCGLVLTIKLVPSEKCIFDGLTCVPKE